MSEAYKNHTDCSCKKNFCSLSIFFGFHTFFPGIGILKYSLKSEHFEFEVQKTEFISKIF